MRTQLESSIRNDYRDNNRIRFSGYAYPSSGYILHRMSDTTWAKYEHVQSVGRLAGIGNNEYMVFTHSTSSVDPGKERSFGGRPDGRQSGNGRLPLRSDAERKRQRPEHEQSYGCANLFANNHPGGLSVLGHTCSSPSGAKITPAKNMPFGASSRACTSRFLRVRRVQCRPECNHKREPAHRASLQARPR